MTLMESRPDPHAEHPPVEDVDELERTVEELRYVSAVIAHDLRQPLAAINGFAHHLAGEAGDDGAKVRHLAEQIVQGCEEIDDILGTAMAYAQATSPVDQRTLVAARAAVEAAWWNVQSLAEERHGHLSVGTLPLLRYDPIQLRQVFQNLFANALTYVAPGTEPAIEVSAERGSSGWELSVRDNGVGMAAAALERPRRYGRTRSGAPQGGSGLGLLICKRIVERHGGALRVAPAPGGGTIVRFDVPDSDGAEGAEGAGGAG